MLDLRQGHALDVLATMPSDSVHCVVTSPPYWGLRSYSIEPVIWPDGWHGHLGMEPTVELYIAHLVAVFSEVKRVLHPSGTCWINLGDSYYGQSSSEYAILREDLSEEDYRNVTLGIWRYMPELWEASGLQASEGVLRNLLQEQIQTGTLGAGERASTQLLSSPTCEVPRSDKEAMGGTENTGNNTTRRGVCLLRGNRGDIPVPRPHQREWPSGVSEVRGGSRCMEEGNEGRAPERQVPSPLLELQFSIRSARFLSSLKLNFTSIHQSIQKYFCIAESGLKPLDLCLIPERFALAMQADGWWVRDRIAWCKTSAMPESVSGTRFEKRNGSGDYVLRRGSWRTTRAWEYIFMFTKSAEYAAFQEQVREPLEPHSENNGLKSTRKFSKITGHLSLGRFDGSRFESMRSNPSGANPRSWWVLGPEPANWDFCLACGTWFGKGGWKRQAVKRWQGKEAGEDGTEHMVYHAKCGNCGAVDQFVSHYALFPSELPKRCIQASTSNYGVCGAKIKRLRLKPDLSEQVRQKVMAYLAKHGLA